MFRMVNNHKRTATVVENEITCMSDDGFDEILDCRFGVGANEDDAASWLLANGYEEFDPAADLKAKGFVWNPNHGTYEKPQRSEMESDLLTMIEQLTDSYAVKAIVGALAQVVSDKAQALVMTPKRRRMVALNKDAVALAATAWRINSDEQQ